MSPPLTDVALEDGALIESFLIELFSLTTMRCLLDLVIPQCLNSFVKVLVPPDETSFDPLLYC